MEEMYKKKKEKILGTPWRDSTQNRLIEQPEQRSSLNDLRNREFLQKRGLYKDNIGSGFDRGRPVSQSQRRPQQYFESQGQSQSQNFHRPVQSSRSQQQESVFSQQKPVIPQQQSVYNQSQMPSMQQYSQYPKQFQQSLRSGKKSKKKPVLLFLIGLVVLVLILFLYSLVRFISTYGF